jgi:hypothetical protein
MEIFNSILHNPDLSNTCLVVDAHNKCVTDLLLLLRLIAQKSFAPPRVMWVVSGHNWPNIEEHLGSVTQNARLSLELNEELAAAPVDRYIQHKVDRLAKTTRDAVRQHLALNADDTFLWAALVC